MCLVCRKSAYGTGSFDGTSGSSYGSSSHHTSSSSSSSSYYWGSHQKLAAHSLSQSFADEVGVQKAKFRPSSESAPEEEEMQCEEEEMQCEEEGGKERICSIN